MVRVRPWIYKMPMGLCACLFAVNMRITRNLWPAAQCYCIWIGKVSLVCDIYIVFVTCGTHIYIQPHSNLHTQPTGHNSFYSLWKILFYWVVFDGCLMKCTFVFNTLPPASCRRHDHEYANCNIDQMDTEWLLEHFRHTQYTHFVYCIPGAYCLFCL